MPGFFFVIFLAFTLSFFLQLSLSLLAGLAALVRPSRAELLRLYYFNLNLIRKV